VQVRPLLGEAWKRRGHLTIADAIYVVLAEQLGAVLVTADGNLARSPGLAVPAITP
jgi:predicted nucleic acid-binding protein